MDQLDDYAVFVAVAETNGFSAAARRIGATTSGVSKSVNRLEDRLGVRLLTRTTRRVALTDEGARFYDRAREITEAISGRRGGCPQRIRGTTGPHPHRPAGRLRAPVRGAAAPVLRPGAFRGGARHPARRQTIRSSCSGLRSSARRREIIDDFSSD